MDVGSITSQGTPRKTYACGEGLYITVTAKGGKTWSYRHAGVFETIGVFPEFSETDARAWISKRGTSDLDAGTWFEAYLEYLKRMKRAPKTILQYEYCFAVLREGFSALKINDLGALKSALVKPLFQWIIQNKTSYAAHHSYPLLGAVYKYMAGSGMDVQNPFGNLKKSYVLESEYKTNGLKSFVDPTEMKEFISNLKDVRNLPLARNCILAIAYLPLRPMEMCSLVRSDLLEDGTILYVPPERNKTRKNLYFPLTRQVQSLFAESMALSGGDYIFANRIGGDGHIDRNALTRLADLLGYKGKIDMHGLRHTFRTIADERLNLDRIILEVILGHNIGTKMDAVYNRSMYMEQKLDILTQWNDWIDR